MEVSSMANEKVQVNGLPMEVDMHGVPVPNIDFYFMKAIGLVESGGKVRKKNTKEDAVGIFQIRPIVVADVNRIIGKKVYSNNSRWSAEKSVKIMYIYLGYYGNLYENTTGNEATDGIYARIWNGGAYGYNKHSTIAYWEKVKEKIIKLKEYYEK